jgi:polynucleotide kinase-phosphatase
MTTISLPELCLVALVGPSGAGKSTFARRHFKPTEVLSSDFFRGLVSDDEMDQSASQDAFEALHFVAAKRLAAGRLTVLDATHVNRDARKNVVALAREYHVFPVAIVFNTPEDVCRAHNAARPDHQVPTSVIHSQRVQLRQSLRHLEEEGFRHVFVLGSVEEMAAATVERRPLWCNRKGERGPFDIVGDVHGCFEELREMLTRLGYAVTETPGAGLGYAVTPPAGRKAVFVGDLVDRGPMTPQVLRLVMGMVAAGTALCVPGNHDDKLCRKLKGRAVNVTHGLAESLEQLGREPPEFTALVRDFLDGLVSHYLLDGGRLVVAHAGMRADLQGRSSKRVRDFALYGETTGETDEFGLPVRVAWAADHRGRAAVVYGHTPVPEAEWLNRTINIDTGCVFGGKLTALRYPEMELVSVPAARTYCEPKRPFLPAAGAGLTAQQRHDDVLDMEDVLGRRTVATRLLGNVVIREENAAAALEAMSRFAADPRWLIYLPPTMSPPETSREPGLLEHPAEAFAYYRGQGVARVVIEEKHMGSRCVVIVCRDEAAARRRFGVTGDESGVCLTRTGRRFFDDAKLQGEFLARLRAALDRSGFWDKFSTDWACLDCELLPWSAKAQELLRQQYAAVGSSARAALAEAVAAIGDRADTADLAERYRRRLEAAGAFTDAYRRYCWSVASVADLKLAPFHLLATEGAVHADRDHVWHMERLAEVCAAGEGLLLATPFRVIELADAASEAEGVRWWEELTGRGGEGMVVKPFDFATRGAKGLPQPAVKCRGREYLRIIYGPEYAAPEHLERLRQRGLSAKRMLALREFALGIEGLERFVRREPLRRVHECAFGVLALESEPVDPRL